MKTTVVRWSDILDCIGFPHRQSPDEERELCRKGLRQYGSQHFTQQCAPALSFCKMQEGRLAPSAGHPARNMAKPRVNLATDPNTPYPTVRRHLSTVNAGMYCSHCGEFFALAVSPPNTAPPDVEFTADGLLLFECPFCNRRQLREASEIVQIRLTQGNRRRPIAPINFH
jgi:hypothetical protein